jgi:putative transposase
VVTVLEKREMVRCLVDLGWSERKALQGCRLSGSVLRYRGVHKEKKDQGLREALKELAEQHSRMGLPMMILKLRQQGFGDNKKRIARIYKEEKLNLRSKKRKRIQVATPSPLTRPQRINESWSADFVFDRVGWKQEGMIKCLTVVDDASDEVVDIYVQPRLGGKDVVYALELLKVTRGLPKRIRTDNGKEFRSKILRAWAQKNKVELLYIQPGKPNQNAIIESFNGRFRDECLNQHQFVTLQQAQQTIGDWVYSFNTQRPKKRLGGLTPRQYADTLGDTKTYKNPTNQLQRIENATNQAPQVRL